MHLVCQVRFTLFFPLAPLNERAGFASHRRSQHAQLLRSLSLASFGMHVISFRMTHWNGATATRLRWFCLTTEIPSFCERRKTPEASMSTKEHSCIPYSTRIRPSDCRSSACSHRHCFAQTVPQIGLKFGINGLAGLQNTNVGASTCDQAGAPGYAQTN